MSPESKKEETQRRLIGLYVYPDGAGGMTFSYAHLSYEETYSDGTVRVVHDMPLYEHEADGGPAWRAIWPLLKAMWRVAVPILEEVARERATSPRKRR